MANESRTRQPLWVQAAADPATGWLYGFAPGLSDLAYWALWIQRDPSEEAQGLARQIYRGLPRADQLRVFETALARGIAEGTLEDFLDGS